MRWLYHRQVVPAAFPIRRVGILAGTFNPVTCAHLALAKAALTEVDEVILALPEQMPHKEFFGATRLEREEMLTAVAQTELHLAAAVTQGGLFADMAPEIRSHYPPGTSLLFLCGRDAAERIVNWPYDSPEALPTFLQSCRLLVAPRRGSYEPPAEYAGAIQPLALQEEYQVMSATEIRRRIQAGEEWESLVPRSIRPMVREIYS